MFKSVEIEVLSHLSYSPDVTPSDYQSFPSVARGLADPHFQSNEELQNEKKMHLLDKSEKWLLLCGTDGVLKLPGWSHL